MPKKIDVDTLMDECVSIQNQIAGLNLLLSNKKSTLAKYFESTGERNISNSDCTCYVQERTDIKYDMEALSEALSKPLLKQFVNVVYTISDWQGFVECLRMHQISAKEIKPYITTTKSVDQNKLSKLYERGELTLSDLNGCYEATTKRSIVLKLKHAENSIPIKE